MPTLGDLFKDNKKLLKRGASSKQVKPKDYDKKVADLENPDDVIESILGRLQQASEFREQFEREWRRAFVAWMQVLDTVKEDSWESKRYMPMVLKQMETALPSVTSAVFNGPNLWTFKGMTPQGRDAADALDKLCHWQARGPSNLEEEFDEMSFWALLFGTGYLDIDWTEVTDIRQTPVVRAEIDPNTGEELRDENGVTVPVKVLEEQEVTVEDWPQCKALNPLDVWAAPFNCAGDNGEWYIYALETTLNKLKEAAGNGHFDKDAIEKWEDYYYPAMGGFSQTTDDTSLFESANSNLWNDWLQDVGLEDRDDQDARDKHDGDKHVKLLVYRSKTETITIAPGKFIIGYSDNPFIHGKTGIISHQFIPIPKCPYGRGLGVVLLPHQELANENINLFMDTSKISLMAPVIVNRANVSTLDRDFIWEPNVIIQSRDVNNAAARMDIPNPSNLAMLLDQHIDAQADEVTGFSQQARGLTPSGVNTATEFTGLQQNIATRLFMHVRRLKRTMVQIGKMFVSLNQQFMTRDQIVDVVGEDGLDYLEVEPWEIVGEVVVSALVSEARANPAMRAQQMLGATQVVLPTIQQGGASPFVMRWIRELLDTIGIEDVDRLIPKNMGKARSAMTENVALRRGVQTPVSEFDDHDQHMAMHAEAMQVAEQEGADEQVLQAYQEHMAEHAQVAEQQAAAAAQQAAQGGGAQDPNRAEATALGQAQGSDGIAGAASPGPQAPAGRPL